MRVIWNRRSTTRLSPNILLISRWISIEYWVIGAVSIQIQPIATIGIFLSKPGNDWIIEAGAEIVLLGNGVKLLTGEFEAVGDGLRLGGAIYLLGMCGVTVLCAITAQVIAHPLGSVFFHRITVLNDGSTAHE